MGNLLLPLRLASLMLLAVSPLVGQVPKPADETHIHNERSLRKTQPPVNPNITNPKPKPCNVSQGRWVYDPLLPLYTGSTCTIGRVNQACQGRGRTNMTFQRMRWKLDGNCSGFTRYNPSRLAQALRRKTMLIAGDSIARNFAHAFQCLLNSTRGNWTRGRPLESWTARAANRTVTLATLRHPGFNFSVGRVVSNFLTAPYRRKNVAANFNNVSLDVLDDTWTSRLPLSDILVLQATAWWFTGNRVWYVGNQKVNLTKAQAYERGMTTVFNYLAKVKYNGTVVLLSHNPAHFNMPPGVATSICRTNLILNSTQVDYMKRVQNDAEILALQRKLVNGTVAKLLDVTTMTLSRPDSHIQNWYRPRGVLGKGAFDDCRHHCEAGAPAMWAEMLYNHLMGTLPL